MKNGRSLTDLATELDRQLYSKQDMLVTSSAMHSETGESGDCQVVIEAGDGPIRFGVTPLARRQLAEKLKIPFLYFEKMRTEQPALLDRNINTWLESDNEKRLIRALDGNVRAVLSDRYRRLDNWDLAENVLPILQQLPGAELVSMELTDTKMYLKVVTSKVKYEIAQGDVVQAGVVITNSEVGHGTLSVQPLLFRLVCTNGLIMPEHGIRKTHLGRILQSQEELTPLFREETMAAEDAAFFMKVSDIVQATVSQVSFDLLAKKMQQTLGIPLKGDPVKSVEVLANRYNLNEGERTGVLHSLIKGGNLSGFGLVNAVTDYSKEIDDYDRATDFELIGGKLVDLTPKEWEEIAEAR